MTAFIKLQLRKNILGLAGGLLAVLLSIPAAYLAAGSGGVPHKDVLPALFGFWILIGLPLMALLYGSLSGTEASEESSKSAEFQLPISQYKRLLGSLAEALIQLAALSLLAGALMGLTNSFPDFLGGPYGDLYGLYGFSLAYLTLAGFTFSYTFKNGVFGGLLGAVSAVVVITHQLSAVFADKLLPPPWPAAVNCFIAALALAGIMAALKIISGLADRKDKKTGLNISAAVLLLIAAPFASLFYFGLVNKTMREAVFQIFSYRGISAAGIKNVNPGFLILTNPASGKVFALDESGKETVIVPPGTAEPVLESILFPIPAIPDDQTAVDAHGDLWLLHNKPHYSRDYDLYKGNLKDGFRLHSAFSTDDHLTLTSINGIGLLECRTESCFYSPIAKSGAAGWKPAGKLKGGKVQRFLIEKYYAAGLAAKIDKTAHALIYQDAKWPLPLKGEARYDFAGVIPVRKLKTGRYFLVPGKKGDDFFTVLCRPGGRAEIVWHEYLTFTTAPDGTVWGETGKTSPSFYILDTEGRTFGNIAIDKILKAAGADKYDGNTGLARMEGETLWFVVDGKFLAKTKVNDTGKFTLWKLPAIPELHGIGEYISPVKVSAGGIFINSVKRVYFMDWNGAQKRIY